MHFSFFMPFIIQIYDLTKKKLKKNRKKNRFLIINNHGKCAHFIYIFSSPSAFFTALPNGWRLLHGEEQRSVPHAPGRSIPIATNYSALAQWRLHVCGLQIQGLGVFGMRTLTLIFGLWDAIPRWRKNKKKHFSIWPIKNMKFNAMFLMELILIFQPVFSFRLKFFM